LPGLGTALLPPGFVGYEEPTAPFASRHPIHIDSALFERDAWNDLGGNHNCRAQITVSPYDPAVATPAAYARLLGTKSCDGSWSITGAEAYASDWRRPDAADPHLWTLNVSYREVGWYGVYDTPAVAAVLFEPERGFAVGLWAQDELYSAEEAIAVVRRVAASLAPRRPRSG
jgi:hypothetical protein